MANSLFPKEMLSTSELSLETIASKLVWFELQLHLIHWQTSSYAEHNATGSLYDFIHDFKDELIEKLIGYTGHKPSVFKIDNLVNTSSINVITDLISFAKDLKKYGEANNFQDVCNLADSLSGESSKIKFLLTLS